LHCCNCYYRTCHAACYITWAVLRAIPKEAKGAVAKIQQDAHTVALLVVACLIVATRLERAQVAVLASIATGIIMAKQPPVRSNP
jgi:hypothetical protein